MTGRSGVRPRPGAASSGRSCPGHGCGACWGPAGEAGAGEAPEDRGRRLRAQAAAPSQRRLRRGSGRQAGSRRAARALLQPRPGRGARAQAGRARARAGREARRRPRARRRRGLRGEAWELSLVLTAGALRAGVRDLPPAWERPHPRPALCGSPWLFACFPCGPRFHRAEIGTRTEAACLPRVQPWGKSLTGVPSGSHLQNGTRSSAWNVGLRMKFNHVQVPGAQ